MARNILLHKKFESRRLINCCKGLIWLYGDTSRKMDSSEDGEITTIPNSNVTVFVCCDLKSLDICQEIENHLRKLGNRILRAKYSRFYEPCLEQIFTCIKNSDCVLLGLINVYHFCLSLKLKGLTTIKELNTFLLFYFKV